MLQEFVHKFYVEFKFSKKIAYNEEVRKLYEEMESQIKIEKTRISAQVVRLSFIFEFSLNFDTIKEKLKEREIREMYEKEIFEKEKQIQELQSKQNELERKILRKDSIELGQKQDNIELLKVIFQFLLTILSIKRSLTP